MLKLFFACLAFVLSALAAEITLGTLLLCILAIYCYHVITKFLEKSTKETAEKIANDSISAFRQRRIDLHASEEILAKIDVKFDRLKELMISELNKHSGN